MNKEDMSYKVTALIEDPNTQKDMYSGMTLDMDVIFAYDPDTYGNGHSVTIKGKNFGVNAYDLRYDRDFDRNLKMSWITNWAEKYWSGQEESWKLKSLQIIRV